MTAGRDLGRTVAVAVATLALLLAVGVSAAAAAPVLSIEQPQSGERLGTSSPSFLGATDDPFDTVTLEIYAGASATGSPVRSAEVLPAEETWQATPAPELADGTYTAVAKQTNGSFEAGVSNEVTFTLDTTPPAVSLAAITTPSNDPTPALGGGAGSASGDLGTVLVRIYQGSAPEGVIEVEHSVAQNVGAWSYTPPALAEGTYTAEVTQADTAGNTGVSAARTFTIDTTKPAVSLGAIPTPSNDPSPTLGGGAGNETGDLETVLVRIYHGSAPVGTVAVEHSVTSSAGAWSYTPSALSDGTYTARAYQSDEAGNEEASAPETFVIDTVAPAVTIATPANNSILHITRPTFSGLAGKSGAPSPDDSTVTLKIYEGIVTSGTPNQILTLPVTSGKWTSGSSGPQLSNSIYTAVVEQSDEAGNTATRSTTFNVSASSPTVTLAPAGLIHRGETPLLGPTPSFTGVAGSDPEDATVVLLKIYPGTSASPPSVRAIEGAVSGSHWEIGTLPPLGDGTYTAQAEQRSDSLGTGVSPTVTFTVDADAPQPTLSSPAGGSSFTAGASIPLSGSAGTAEGDSPTITARLFAGTSIVGQAPLETVSVAAVGGSWSTALGGLSPGTYTVSAQQEDDVHNAGTSAPATFTVTAPPAPPGPPVASFQWFPVAPHVGEPVSLVSTSSDAASLITSYAWSLAASGAFTPGGSLLSTTFSTPGSHVVRLSVTDAAGRSSSVAATIAVAARSAILMQPFPVVRIAGSESARGVSIGLFTVLAPTGARVTVRCRGRGCPAKARSVIATARTGKRKAGTVLIVFKHFQRTLGVGAVLEIRVAKAGQIGKYTRFVVRRGKLPSRQDTCLTPAGVKPMACPSS